MTSLPSADINKASWMKNIHWPTSPPFRLRWLSKVAVPFSRIGYLKNPLNENLSVLIAKDGQEVEEDCGCALLRKMEFYAEWESNKTAFPSGSRQRPQQHARRESDSAPGFNPPASWWKNKKKPHNNNSNWNNQRNTKRADDYHDRFPAR